MLLLSERCYLSMADPTRWQECSLLDHATMGRQFLYRSSLRPVEQIKMIYG